MTFEPNHNNLNSTKLQLKLGLHNVENLFLLFDPNDVPPNYLKLSEALWQKLSNSVYETKELNKCIQLAQIITENSPDIMMLCEVGGAESLNNFNKLFLDDQYQVALLEGNSDRNIDVGYLIKKESPFFYDITSNRHRPLNFLYPHEVTSKKTGYPLKKDSQYFSRDCVELRLFTKTKDQPFLILLLTHLKSRLDPDRIDPGGTEKRSAELNTCLAIYKELRSQFADVPIIFSGDMNGYAGKPHTDPEFLPIYTETDLQDILEIANVDIKERSTFYQVRNGGKTDGKQIDYCFLSNHLADKLIISTAQVYRYKDSLGLPLNEPKSLDEKLRLASDHYPIFFNLENINFK